MGLKTTKTGARPEGLSVPRGEQPVPVLQESCALIYEPALRPPKVAILQAKPSNFKFLLSC